MTIFSFILVRSELKRDGTRVRVKVFPPLSMVRWRVLTEGRLRMKSNRFCCIMVV
jgi:hypothetical protein